MTRVRLERFGFGIGVDGDFVDVAALVKRIKAAGVPDLGLENYEDLEGSAWRGLYWGSWDSVEESVKAAAYRAERSTQLEPTDVDDYLSGKTYAEQYFYSLQLQRFYDYARPRIRRRERPKVLVLGCGSGESLLDLEIHGFEAYGIEYGPVPFLRSGPLARTRMSPGDFLVDLARYERDSFDYVITDRLSLVSDNDIDALAQDIRYICRGTFFAPYVKLPGSLPRAHTRVGRELIASGLKSAGTWLYDCSTEVK